MLRVTGQLHAAVDGHDGRRRHFDTRRSRTVWSMSGRTTASCTRSTRRAATNCSGSPKTCAPLWTAATGGSNRVLSDGCATGSSTSGPTTATSTPSTPQTGRTQWVGPTGYRIGLSSPAVVDTEDVVFIANGNGVVYAFERVREENCAGTQLQVCEPSWFSDITPGYLAVGVSSPVVVNGVLYIGVGPGPGDTLVAFTAPATDDLQLGGG